MKIIVPPEEFHRLAQFATGHSLTKTEAYFLWLQFGVEQEGGPTSRVPLGLIARLNEEVRTRNGYESYAEVADRLRESGVEYDRRNVKSRVSRGSGFDADDVLYWADRDPARRDEREASIPPDHLRYIYWEKQWHPPSPRS
jgi:hypothetical protein